MSTPRLPLALDVLANALAFGRHVQSLSKRAAQARKKGKPWGCTACRWLSKLFREETPGNDHCDRALKDREQGY